MHPVLARYRSLLASRLAGVGIDRRPATVDDADAMGQAHVLAWQAAYVGLMPRTALSTLTSTLRCGDGDPTARPRSDPGRGRGYHPHPGTARSPARASG